MKQVIIYGDFFFKALTRAATWPKAVSYTHLMGVAPMDWAASMTPASTSLMEDSTIRATKGAAPMTLSLIHIYIKRITAKEDAKRYLAGLGLVEGAAVTVVSHQGEDMILNVKGARVALGRNYTKRIMI